MDTEAEQVTCPEHGEATATYVCEHLAADPMQRWHSDYPSADAPWPDAWCSACNVAYMREGEWNERNEDDLEIRILCHCCYENARADSVGYLDGDALERWEEFVCTCCEELTKKNEALGAQFALGSHKRYDWDQETGQLVFSNDGVPAVTADVDFVGSISTTSNTWLWAWANFHLLEPVRARVEALRDYGEAHGFPHLTTAKWPAEMADGWEMAAIAAHVLQAKGVYRSPSDKGALFMLISGIRKHES